MASQELQLCVMTVCCMKSPMRGDSLPAPAHHHKPGHLKPPQPNLQQTGKHCLTSCMGWQAQDARAAQCTAEAIALTCQRELSQVSTSLASQLEAESMWQGRAQGLQQQLDQAMQDQRQMQQDMAAVQAAVSHRHQSIRCVGLVVDQHPDLLHPAKHSQTTSQRCLVRKHARHGRMYVRMCICLCVCVPYGCDQEAFVNVIEWQHLLVHCGHLLLFVHDKLTADACFAKANKAVTEATGVQLSSCECRMLEQKLAEQASTAELSRQDMDKANKGLTKQLVSCGSDCLLHRSEHNRTRPIPADCLLVKLVLV